MRRALSACIRSFSSRRIARCTLPLLLLLCSACREQILHNLSELDVTRIESRLENQGISATRERQTDGRWTISVYSEDSSRAIQLIQAHRLLREERSADDGKSSMLASREDQRFHYERSLSRELEATLGTLEGVLEARVHLNLPPMDPIFDQPLAKTPGTASVLLIVGSEFRAQSSEVAAMISGASGIPVERVAVLFSKPTAPTSPSRADLVVPPLEQGSEPPSSVLSGLSGWAVRRSPQLAAALLILGIGLVMVSRSMRLRRVPDLGVSESSEAYHAP